MAERLIKDVAREDAATVLADYWNDQFPVDPFTIAEKLGIKVWASDLPEHVSGLLVKQENSAPEIHISRSEGRARQRFTCAHEIGHFIDRRNHGDLEYGFEDGRDDTPKTPIEFYADHFAANLLMPSLKFQSKLDAGYTPADLMEFFGVSRTALDVRTRSLGL